MYDSVVKCSTSSPSRIKVCKIELKSVQRLKRESVADRVNFKFIIIKTDIIKECCVGLCMFQKLKTQHASMIVFINFLQPNVLHQSVQVYSLIIYCLQNCEHLNGDFEISNHIFLFIQLYMWVIRSFKIRVIVPEIKSIIIIFWN